MDIEEYIAPLFQSDTIQKIKLSKGEQLFFNLTEN